MTMPPLTPPTAAQQGSGAGAGSQQVGTGSQQTGSGAGSQQTGSGTGSQQAGSGVDSQQQTGSGAGSQHSAPLPNNFFKKPPAWASPARETVTVSSKAIRHNLLIRILNSETNALMGGKTTRSSPNANREPTTIRMRLAHLACPVPRSFQMYLKTAPRALYAHGRQPKRL
jgi:hypothetical protein